MEDKFIDEAPQGIVNPDIQEPLGSWNRYSHLVGIAAFGAIRR